MSLAAALIMAWTLPLITIAWVYEARRRDEQRRRQRRRHDYEIIRRMIARNRRRGR